jgi:hypothetical protein
MESGFIYDLLKVLVKHAEIHKPIRPSLIRYGRITVKKKILNA